MEFNGTKFSDLNMSKKLTWVSVPKINGSRPFLNQHSSITHGEIDCRRARGTNFSTDSFLNIIACNVVVLTMTQFFSTGETLAFLL